MWQYIVVFVLSSVMAGIAEQCLRKKRSIFYYFFGFCAIIFPAILAGLRSDAIGSDVLTYGNIVFDTSRDKTFFELVELYSLTIEPLYLLLNYIVSSFTNDSHWLYFVIQLIIDTLVFCEIKRNRHNAKMWLSYWTFLTLFYGFNLNGMRQSVGMAIMLYAYRYVLQRNIRKYCLFVLLAMGFHYVCIVYILFFFINEYINSERNAEVKKRRIKLLVIAILLSSMLYRVVLGVFVYFVPKYERYYQTNAASFLLNPFLIRIPFVIALILLYKPLSKRRSNVGFLFGMLVMDLVYAQFRSINVALYRISLLPGMFKIDAYPLIGKAFMGKWKIVVEILISIVLFIIWYYQVVVSNNDSIYPYSSDIVRWLN